MSDAQRYRENAAECERLASRSVGEPTRLAFKKMAQEWRVMAEKAEGREGVIPVAPAANTDEPKDAL